MTDIEQTIRDLVHRVARDEVRQALAEALRPDEYLSTSAAAQLAHVTTGTVRRWVKAGKLRRHGEGKRVLRVSRNELERLMKSGAQNDEMSPEELARKRFG